MDPSQLGAAAGGEKLQHITLLLPTGGHHAEHALDEAASCLAIGTGAALAPEHRIT